MWCYRTVSGALFPKSTCQPGCCRYSQPCHCPGSPRWQCSPWCQLWELQRASSTAEEQGLCSAGSTPDLSLPVRQSRATYRTPVSHQVTLYTLPLNGQVSNDKAWSQERLQLPGNLELLTVAATYIAYYFVEIQDSGFRNIRLVASQHTYIPIIFCNIKNWLLFIHISPCYQVHLPIKNKWI